MKTKNQWASKLGFIMATAGAAIGLGNLWGPGPAGGYVHGQ